MKNTNNENLKNIESLIIKDSKLNLEKLLKKYDTSLEGISIINEEEKIEKYGKNIIDIKENNTIWHKLKEAFINPFNIVLIIVAIITFITDVVIATQKDYATFILIISTVIISAIISIDHFSLCVAENQHDDLCGPADEFLLDDFTERIQIDNTIFGKPRLIIQPRHLGQQLEQRGGIL